jgi:hypothetical protein
MTYSQKANYVVRQILTGPYSSPRIWIPSLNEVSFQMQWDPGVATGTLTLLGSNQDLPLEGTAIFVVYPPPLTPMILAPPINVATAPYPTNLAGYFDITTAAQFVWIEYVGPGGGSLSIAFSGKSFM